MWMHRLCGVALILLGAAIIGAEFALLYGPNIDPWIMLSIGVPGVGFLTIAALAILTAGLGLAGAPDRVVHHARRTASAIRGLGRRSDVAKG